MCGRYNLRSKMTVLAKQFQVDVQATFDWEPRYNIPPTASVPVVRLNDGKRELVQLKWGLIPSWAKDAKLAQINARGDTVATKPMFRSAYKKRRCLIPATGYYEWLREGKDKQPFLYEVDDGKPFAMAGIWEWWGGQPRRMQSSSRVPLSRPTPMSLRARFMTACPSFWTQPITVPGSLALRFR